MSSYFPYARSKTTTSVRTARNDEDNTISETTAETENEMTAVSLALKDDKTQIEKENEESTVISDTHTEHSLKAGLKVNFKVFSFFLLILAISSFSHYRVSTQAH